MQVHSKNFNVAVQALMLLDKISSKNHIVSDRFYRALYSKLLLPAAMNSSKASKLGLIYIFCLRAFESLTMECNWCLFLFLIMHHAMPLQF